MPLTDAQLTRLLGAIETDSLIFLCGAGLSMAPPTSLLSAKVVAQTCYDRWLPTETLNPAWRDDIDQIAGYFHTKGTFENVFLRLVPWQELLGPPNAGHAAIADFLICRAARGALSANFDPAIETWAEERKVDLRGAINGQEAVEFATTSSPLVKFHGCLRRDRENTLWTQGQLQSRSIQDRSQTCSQWMNLNLPDKHLVVVGFWTDWGYLNDVLAAAFTVTNAASVLVIDPSTSESLQQKAPRLWNTLGGLSRVFEHVQASGAEILHELRTGYSRVWARKFFALGEPLMRQTGGAVPENNTLDTLESEALYNLRRDVEGVSYSRAATQKSPAGSSAQVAFLHMLLRNAGAQTRGAWLEHGTRSVRIVNGAGRALAEMKASYTEPPSVPNPDLVVCAGAIDLGLPSHLISAGRGASVVRPAPGSGSKWLTLEEGRRELGV